MVTYEEILASMEINRQEMQDFIKQQVEMAKNAAVNVSYESCLTTYFLYKISLLELRIKQLEENEKN